MLNKKIIEVFHDNLAIEYIYSILNSLFMQMKNIPEFIMPSIIKLIEIFLQRGNEFTKYIDEIETKLIEFLKISETFRWRIKIKYVSFMLK